MDRKLNEVHEALFRLSRGLYGDKPSTLSQRKADAMIVATFLDNLMEVGLPAFVPATIEDFRDEFNKEIALRMWNGGHFSMTQIQDLFDLKPSEMREIFGVDYD